MRKKIGILILVVVLLFVFCLARDFFIKSLIGSVAASVTGAPTSIGGLSLSVIRQTVKISDFKMYNPKGFPRDILVDIPRINVACNLGALITGKIHLRQLDLEIKEIGMVKNKEGKLNIDSLKIAEDKSGKEEKKPAKQMAMQIDTLGLGMGRVVSRDYSVEGPPVIKVYDINLKKTYKNIIIAEQMFAFIISEPLKAAGIQGLKVYGVAMFTGVAALPVVAAFTFSGKDYVQETFNVTMDRAYDAGLQVIKMAGKIEKENKAGGVISAVVSGARVTFKLKKLSGKSTQVTISARKTGLPQVETASGVMYQLSEQLK
ncbi:MAG: AsmA family protein [Candidatus Omnitrophica bacterium]|nr:AsmA family protein [Candidatus Omnitrophota bacterium]